MMDGFITIPTIRNFRIVRKEVKRDVSRETVAKIATVQVENSRYAELFQIKPQNITVHLKDIYTAGKLEENVTCKDFLQVQGVVL